MAGFHTFGRRVDSFKHACGPTLRLAGRPHQGELAHASRELQPASLLLRFPLQLVDLARRKKRQSDHVLLAVLVDQKLCEAHRQRTEVGGDVGEPSFAEPGSP